MLKALSLAYRFKPLRTAAQVMAPGVGASSIFDVDWKVTVGLAAAAGAASFLQIVGEGGDLFADDARVTGSKAQSLIARHLADTAPIEVQVDGKAVHDALLRYRRESGHGSGLI